jgi:hypothetical protein
MKHQSKIRTQLAIAGLGAALLLAGAAKAQEIVNTSFDDGPDVTPFTQQGSVDANANANASHALPGSQAVLTTEAINAPANQSVPVENNDDEHEGLIWTGVVLVWIGAIGLYAGGPAKRFTRELRILRASHLSTPGF